METTSALHRQILHQYLLRLSPPPSPPPVTNLRRPHKLRRRQDVQDQSQFSMPLTDLTLRRITTIPAFRFRFNHHHQKHFSLNNDITSIHPKIMSDQPKKTDIQPTNADATSALDVSKARDEKQNESEKSTPPAPPPPEKPLPGDCCGSGCVRCVWDVYYEELEEYDTLYKAK